MTTICKSCGAKIRFVEMASGKKMPIEENVKNIVAKFGEKWKTITGYESHFANCPGADLHRKPNLQSQGIPPLKNRDGGA
jgi:hypothetical protein